MEKMLTCALVCSHTGKKKRPTRTVLLQLALDMPSLKITQRHGASGAKAFEDERARAIFDQTK